MKLIDIVTLNKVIPEIELTKDMELVTDIQKRYALLDLYPDNSIDGRWGEYSEKATELFCTANWLNNHQTNTYGKSFADKLLEDKPVSKSLNLDNLKDAAKELGIELACIRAVVAVESAGSGFLKSGKPQILFEAHHFSKWTGRKYDVSNPGISSKMWNPILYKGGELEWKRFDTAAKLSRIAAIKSCSYGLFQVLGSNAKDLGYKSEEEFFSLMHKSENEHLQSFVRFVRRNDLVKYLKSKDFAAFAKRYNGPLFQKNKYDIKLKEAYIRFNVLR